MLFQVWVGCLIILQSDPVSSFDRWPLARCAALLFLRVVPRQPRRSISILVAMADRRLTRSRSRKTPAVIAYENEETLLNTSTGNLKGSSTSSSSAKSRPAAASTSTTRCTRSNRAQIFLTREKQKGVAKDKPHNKKSSSASTKKVEETKGGHVSSSSITDQDASKRKTETSSEEPVPHSSTFMVPDSVGDMEDIANVKKPSWVPTDWRKTLRYIRRMRAEKAAPVDTMGSERTMEENLERKVINSH